jgi:hypothetical protein
LGFNPAQIGTVLIVGGVFLIGFQLAVFPKLLVRAFSTLHIPPP